MKKYFFRFAFWIKNLFFSYFYQLSKLKFIGKKKLINMFVLLILLFFFLGLILLGTNSLFIEIFKSLKLL